MDYYATVKKNEEAVSGSFTKNLQNIIKWERHGTKTQLTTFCVKKEKAYNDLPLLFKKHNLKNQRTF